MDNGRLWRDNGLTIVLLAVFALSIIGQLVTGWRAASTDAGRHGEAAPGLAGYLVSGDFLSAVFENWESEFLQMAAYVILTAVLFQRGSAESRDPDETTAEAEERERPRADSPWPTRRGPLLRLLYANSLGIALAALFIASFALHWWGSWRAAVDDAMRHGGQPPPALDYVADARFWFESLQNWQSEFLSTAALVVLTIFLRQRNSPESKPVHAPTAQTGG
ncbi:MAG: hypothetical protein IT561_03200 [Alphaproteobacteria bacterium]|nr:hypothetical protein [Alphaproteobacteria bacterium]